ncbi:cytochrome P450 [Durotheca rogersii]|uniref:cytochrome P450 n=1 Tax=Durotheca rogersii TaxID=419775 RepID=UPI002220C067|nr:cytochrome P450 [Durotheca rogersii]KAI5861022.1 cytochrome P450 [Durotheca rogersii]
MILPPAAQDPVTGLFLVGALSVVALVFNYFYYAYQYHKAQRGREESQLPPKYPTWLPYVGSAIPYLRDGPEFLRKVTSYAGQLTSIRVTFLPGWDIYFFQDRHTIREIWKKSNLMKSVSLRIFFYRYIFGMPQRSVAMYYEDDSGPFPKPYPGTSVPPEKRIHHTLYEGTHQALAGSGFNPTLQRFRAALLARVASMGFAEDWAEMEDFQRLILHTTGQSFVEAIFGPSLLRLSPTFMDDLKEFNRAVPLFAKATPRFLIPHAYAARQKMHNHLKRWYAYAREHFDESSIGADGDADPFWGSAWMRHRQKTLDKIQDDDTLAASDLGAAWGSVVNLVPSTIMALVHILRDESVHQRVMQEIEQSVGDRPLADIDVKALSENQLLSSIYAETLRLHVKLNTVISSQRADLKLGRWWLPRGSIGLVNSHISHMDAAFWNTKQGAHPVERFWADRFLRDPADPLSGPINPAYRETQGLGDAKAHVKEEETARDGPYFSMEGLEESWVPYGGGHLVCPGRFLAKSAIMFTCVLFLREFEVELLSEVGELCSSNFGIGTEEPKRPVKFRIRRRLGREDR